MKYYRYLPPLGVVLALILVFALRSSSHRVPIDSPTIIVNASPFQSETIPNVRPTIEMAFVLDTTGSMGGLIDAAKQKIWSIINSVMQSPSHPKVKVGLVAYRDHGDVYVTKVLQMTDDLDKVYETLMQYQADGGGDIPEDVRQAMTDAVHKVGWSHQAPGMAQIMFLVGDAPPHDDYVNEPDCLTSAEEAVHNGIIVNAIECGSAEDTKQSWQQIARRGQGQFMAISENGGVQLISTPYDEELSRLGTSVSHTYVAYGGSSFGGGRGRAMAFRTAKRMSVTKIENEVAAAAPASVKADRAINKAINAEAYSDDLVQDVENHKISVNTLKKEDLPDDLQKLSADALKAEVDRRVAERKEIQGKILDLSKKRDAFISDARKKLSGGSAAADGFDSVVTKAIKQEAATKGVKL